MGAPPRRTRSPLPGYELGARGEEHAAAHLSRRGFRIVARNVRSREGEIDLIACDGTTLAFVEVKTRTSRRRRTGTPLERLDGRQRARLRRLAACWLADRGVERPRAQTIRFDAIGVVVDPSGRLVELEHLAGAW